MKLKSAPLIAGLCLISMASVSAFGDTTSSPSEDQLIQSLSQKTAALESEVGQLRSEIKHLQAKKTITQRAKSMRASSMRTTYASSSNSSSEASAPGLILKKPYQPGHPQYAEVHFLNDQPIYIGGTPIMASPYLGVRSKFDGTDLLSSVPVVNEDLRFLTQEQKMRNEYDRLGLPLPGHPLIDLSGELQATAIYQRPFTGAKTSDINLTDAELDTGIIFNPWVMGFMTIFYDNTPPALGPRFANSRFYVDRGFLSIGNLNCFPMYASVGQLYVPFGQYTSAMVSAPLTQQLARTQARAVVLGYDEMGTYNGLNATAYVFRGDSRNPPANSFFTVGKVNNGGVNLDYSINNNKWNGDLAAGYIANIADSQGMQLVPGQAGSFQGFGGPLPVSGAEALVHRVPAVDVHGMVGVGAWDLIAEYVLTTTNFSSSDMTFNSHSAKPRAFHTELGYALPITQPTNVDVGYDQTTDSLALLLPQKRYIAVLNTSFWRDTIESLEYRHDINYSSSSRATGQEVPVFAAGLGNTSDTVSLQMTAFF